VIVGGMVVAGMVVATRFVAFAARRGQAVG
jgi:hypothetical protein